MEIRRAIDDHPLMATRSLTRDDVLTMREVAELLRLPLSTVSEFARRGTLPARKLGRRWIFLRDELEDAIRAFPTGPGHRA